MARVVLLTQLKVFHFLGRFAPVTDIPANVIEHIMAKLGTVAALPLAIGENRLYRDHGAIRQYLVATIGRSDHGHARRSAHRPCRLD